MGSTQIDDAVTRTKRLVSLYERKLITEASLVGEIANVVTPENIRCVMECLPPSALRIIHDWAKTLPEDDEKRIVFWPLASGVRLSFKEWLLEQEQQGENKRNGS
jgi:hypothetical protein